MGFRVCGGVGLWFLYRMLFLFIPCSVCVVFHCYAVVCYV